MRAAAEDHHPVARPDGRMARAPAGSFGERQIGPRAGQWIETRAVGKVHLDVEVERYFRDNDLRVNVYSCGLGFLF